MTLSKLKQEGREEFEKEFLEFSYCGDRECEYDGEGKCFHGTEIEMKVFLTAQIEKAYLSALSDVEKEVVQIAGLAFGKHQNFSEFVKAINKLKEKHE